MLKLFSLLAFILLSAACHPQTGAKTSDTKALVPVYFEIDQSEIADNGAIQSNARWLLSNKDKVVVLEGHCDERGDRQYNLWLGDRRARSVMGALMAQGVPENQMIIVSYGKDRPRQKVREGWAKNRRVEFVVR